jgi:hypothetical protein
VFKTLEAAEIWEDWLERGIKIAAACNHMFIEPTDLSVDQCHSMLISAHLVADDLRRLADLLETDVNQLTDKLNATELQLSKAK